MFVASNCIDDQYVVCHAKFQLGFAIWNIFCLFSTW